MRTIALILISLLALALDGCVETAPQTKAAVQQIQQKSQIDLAKQQADAALAAAKAKTHPTLHVVTSVDQIVSAVRAALLPIFILSVVVLGGSIGLAFSPLSFVSKISLPISAAIAGLSLLNLIAMPFLPWGLLAGAVVAAAVLIYEIVRYKSLPKGIAGFEADLGLRAGSAANAQAALAAAAPKTLNLTK